jgi:Flp pilus assembly CpaE family ATPase
LRLIRKGLRALEKKALTVLLVEDSPDYAELVQDWLAVSREDMSFVLNWSDSVSAGVKRLAAGGVDVILLDLGLPDSNGAPTFAKIRAQAPDIPVIVLSAGDSESLALQLIQEGAEDYLVKNTCNSDALVRAVRYAFLRHGSQASKSRAVLSTDQSRVVGVIGAKGGLGTSTIAYNLAAELRLQTEEKVLLGDLDVHTGQAAFLAGVEPQYTFLNAIENQSRLDLSFWGALVTEGPLGLHIMPSPALLGQRDLDSNAVMDVLKVALPFYRWTVLDLGVINPLSMALASKVHEIFLVTSTAIGALYETKRVIGAFVNAQVDVDRIRLIVNRFENRSFSGSELNSIFGIPVYTTLSTDEEEMQKSCLEKTLPSEASNFRKQMVKLARKVAGLPEKKPKGTLGPLFPFAKFRRTDANPGR